MHDGIEFSKADRVETLTAGQIDLLARTQHDIFISCMRERPGYFDIERIRILLDMGVIEAKRRAAELTPNVQGKGRPACGTSQRPKAAP